MRVDVRVNRVLRQYSRTNDAIDDGWLCDRGRWGLDAFDSEERLTTPLVRRDGEPVVRLCHVKGLDHAWAGGDEAVPFHAAVGPDASAMIWSFFEQNRRTVATERRTV